MNLNYVNKTPSDTNGLGVKMKEEMSPKSHLLLLMYLQKACKITDFHRTFSNRTRV